MKPALPRLLFILCLFPFSAILRAQAPAAPAPQAAAISPDGATVAWTLKQGDQTTLHLTNLADPDPAKERLIAPNGTTACSNSSPVWSPDGATLAFTSTCTGQQEHPGQEQIFLWSKATAEVHQLTHITGLFKQAAWSPNGKSIAFLFVENASRLAGALDAMKPWAGVIGEDNLEIQGVYAVDIATGKGNWLVPATPEMYTFEFAWAPNSTELAIIAAKAPGENNWWVAKLMLTSFSSGCPTCRFYNPAKTAVILDPAPTPGPLHGLQIAVPRFSPDGKTIAFIGGLMSDQGATGGDLYVIDAKPNSHPIDITPNIDGTPTWEIWLSNDKIGFAEDRRGHILLTDADLHTRNVVPNSSDDLGEVSITGAPIKNAISASNNGIIAFVESSFAHPAEVFAGTLEAPKQLTHIATTTKPTPKIESLEWQNDGLNIQGWLTYPANFDPAKKYPLIVTVHGGPSGSAFPRNTDWSTRGYFEFQPNPRGSFGQGEKFVQANIKDFGYGDLRDILKGMDTIEARIPAIDTHREGLIGWSYGGFMTMFALTQTHRFRAAMAGAGISDWLSYYGENSIDQWMVPFFGATVYNDPAVYAKSSAINYIKNVTTPTLVIVGDRDGECPAPQSFEFWHALRDLGVKTQLVIYPNEGHGFKNQAHIDDRSAREAKWFADNMK